MEINYDDLKKYKTQINCPNDIQIAMIQADMKRIDNMLLNGDKDELQALHKELDGTYQNFIRNWESSTYNYVKGQGYIYEYLDDSALRDNLVTFRGKLRGLLLMHSTSEEDIKFLNKISIGESTSTLHEKEVNPSNSRFNMYDRIQKRELNVSQEYARIWKLFNTGDIVGPRATSLRVYMDGCIQFFPNTFRRRSLTLHDFNEIYGFEFKPPHESITEDQLVSYCEYVITLCDYLWEYAGDCLDEDAEDLREALYETVESCIDELGLTSIKKDGITIYIDKDPAVVAVAELLEESLAYDAKSFIHKGTKGNLYKKKTILKFLADEIENDKKALRSINKALESNLFQMLNKFIRHNNEENLFIKSLSPENLEACYDDIYQMWLLAKLELSNLERKKRVEDILRKINL